MYTWYATILYFPSTATWTNYYPFSTQGQTTNLVLHMCAGSQNSTSMVCLLVGFGTIHKESSFRAHPTVKVLFHFIRWYDIIWLCSSTVLSGCTSQGIIRLRSLYSMDIFFQQHGHILPYGHLSLPIQLCTQEIVLVGSGTFIKTVQFKGTSYSQVKALLITS